MIALTKLLRRTAVALSAIAALTVTGLATAQTVVLSGTTSNTCTYTSMTPSGATLTFTCANSNTASFTITAPAQLPQNVLSTSDVKVTRTGGLAGTINVDVTAGGNCALSVGSPATYVTNTTIQSTGVGSVAIPMLMGLVTNGTTCTIDISPQDGSPVTGTHPKTINVVDPDADVVFAFATADTAASVGNGSVGITVTRTGGTNGTFTVPINVVPAASGGGNLIPGTAGGTLSTTTLNFANANPVSFTYTAPTANPAATITPPWTMVLSLGTPTKTSAASAQVGTSSGTLNTITLSPKSTSCNATVNSIAMTDVPTVQLASGVMYTYELPRTYARKVSGTFKMSSTTISNPVAPWNYEFQISKCAGQIDPTVGGTCYITSSNSAQLSLTWFESVPAAGSTGATAGYGSIAGIQSKGACYAPATDGPWYVNIRYNYADCNAAIAGHPLCGWKATAALWSY